MAHWVIRRSAWYLAAQQYRMIRSGSPTLVAKDGRKLYSKQGERILEDQEASCRKWIDTSSDLPYDLAVTVGECNDRQLNWCRARNELDEVACQRKTP